MFTDLSQLEGNLLLSSPRICLHETPGWVSSHCREKKVVCVMCNSPSSLFGDKSMLSTSTKGNTYLHLLPTLFAHVQSMYMYKSTKYIPKNTKFVYVQILKYTSNCNSFSIHKLRFYRVVRAMMGPEVQHLQGSTEHRGNKDIFTSPSFHYFIHPHTRSPIW